MAATAASRSPPTSRRACAPRCRTPGSAATPSEALAIHERLTPLHKALFLETSPAPVKYAAARLGRCAPEVRLPLVPPKAPTRERGRCRDGRGRADELRRALAKEQDSGRKVVARNRRATHDYFIDERVEAGIVLQGTEVKALRDGRGNINEAYAGERAASCS